MSVLIKGMNMPKDDCEALRQITITNVWVDGEIKMLAHDTVTNEFIGEVVDVPTPHGRLVEFIDVIAKINEDDGTEEVCVGDVFKAYYEMKNAPTVIEGEE